MGTKFKVFICVLLLIAVVASMGFAEGKSAIPAYLLSFFVGFGTGHLYSQVTWVPWLVADAVAVGVMAIGGIMVFVSATSALNSAVTGDVSGTSGGLGAALIWYVVAGLGGTAYGIIRLIEFINIFKVVKQQKEAGVIASWSPTFEVLPTGIAAGLKYSY